MVLRSPSSASSSKPCTSTFTAQRGSHPGRRTCVADGVTDGVAGDVTDDVADDVADDVVARFHRIWSIGRATTGSLFRSAAL